MRSNLTTPKSSTCSDTALLAAAIMKLTVSKHVEDFGVLFTNKECPVGGSHHETEYLISALFSKLKCLWSYFKGCNQCFGSGSAQICINFGRLDPEPDPH
jgi:hypothetical protein